MMDVYSVEGILHCLRGLPCPLKAGFPALISSTTSCRNAAIVMSWIANSLANVRNVRLCRPVSTRQYYALGKS